MHWSSFVLGIIGFIGATLLFIGSLTGMSTGLTYSLSEQEREKGLETCSKLLIIGILLSLVFLTIVFTGFEKKTIIEEKNVSVHLLSVKFQRAKYSYVTCSFMDLDRNNKIVEEKIRSFNWKFESKETNFPNQTKRIEYVVEPRGFFKLCGVPNKQIYEYPEIQNIYN